MTNGVTIRFWNGSRAVSLFTVNPDGGGSWASGYSGGASNSGRADVELDPWAGFIVDTSVSMGGPVNYRAAAVHDCPEPDVADLARAGLVTAREHNAALLNHREVVLAAESIVNTIRERVRQGWLTIPVPDFDSLCAAVDAMRKDRVVDV